MRCFIFDIDGTIADATHRLHFIHQEKKDWDAFFAACHGDTPIPHIIELAQACAAWEAVIYVSGRSDQCRLQTEAWMRKYALPVGDLYMRKEGDHRPDHVVKLELLQKLRAEGHEIIMSFDDRDQVVSMWRANGIPCAQVAEGDF